MKTEVLSLILSRPNVRTVEIADRLDMEPDAVRPLIADEIARGVIVEESIVAPNGRPVLSFRYASAAPAAAVVSELAADPFPARVLRALPPTERPVIERERPLSSRPAPPPPPPAADPLTLALSPAHVTPEHSDEPLEIDVSVTRKEGVPSAAAIPAVFTAGRAKTMTRVELALACLRAAEGKPVFTVDLASAMGLPSGHHPTSYLKQAMTRGRVVRSGTMWTLGPNEPGYVALVTAQEPKPAGPVFPRADPAALAAYVPGSKRCTMNCGPHADDPRSAAERAVLCDDCELVEVAAAPVAQVAAELPAQEPDVAGACLAGIAGNCDCDDCKTVAALQSELALAPVAAAPVEPALDTPAEQPAAQVAEAPTLEVPRFLDLPTATPKWTPEAARAKAAARKGELPTGGLPNIKTSYLPRVASGAPDITRNGLYVNGDYRTGPEEFVFKSMGVSQSETARLWVGNIEIGGGGAMLGFNAGQISQIAPPAPANDAAAERFLAGVMSDGSLEIRVPGQPQCDLTPEQARELYQFLRAVGYAAWPTAA